MKEQGCIFYSSDTFSGGTAESGITEFELSNEILIPNFNVLAISGDSGTGKSTLGRGLAKLLGIKIADVGDQIREKTKERTGKEVVGFADRDVSVDKEFDKATADIIWNALNSEPSILVARMGPWVAKKQEIIARENWLFFPRVVTFNLTASPKTKQERIIPRERVKYPKMTDMQIVQKIQSGNAQNQDNWHLAHPDLEGNPLNPDAKYLGENIFEFTINTDGLDENEVLLKAIKLLEEANYLTKKSEPENFCNQKSA